MGLHRAAHPHIGKNAPTAIVVGGGVSGLLAARELAAAGVRVTLLEQKDHLGGAVGAHEVGGCCWIPVRNPTPPAHPSFRSLLKSWALGSILSPPTRTARGCTCLSGRVKPRTPGLWVFRATWMIKPCSGYSAGRGCAAPNLIRPYRPLWVLKQKLLVSWCAPVWAIRC